MKKIFVAMICAVTMLPLTAQEKSAKIGVVNIGKVIKAHWKYDTVKERVENKQDEVEKTFQKIQSEGRELLETLQQLDEDLKNPLLNDATRKEKEEKKGELQREVKKKSIELERARVQLRKELQGVEQEEMNSLIKEILDEVKAFGKNNGYSMIHDATSTPGRMSSVVYYDDDYELTDAIIAVINAGHETSNTTEETPDKKSETP